MLLKKKAFILPILYMGFIFVLSSIPGNEEKIREYSLAKQVFQNLLHIPLFGLLSFLWVSALTNNNTRLKKALTLGLIITVIYALFDEMHQSFVPGRYAGLGDFTLDAIGSLGGLLAYWLIDKYNACIEKH